MITDTGSWRARAALIAMGCAVVVLVEIALRWLVPLDPATSQGFAGAPPPFVLERTDDGRERYVVHPARRHSFPPQSFSADRASGAVLVFCIGGSSVYGYPFGADYAFPRRLQEALGSAHPERSFEVVNVGGMSYGSRRLVALTLQLVRYKPDVLVVYTGHNEFVEEDVAREAPRLPTWLETARRLHIFRVAAALIAPEPAEVEAEGEAAFGIDVRRREDRLVKSLDVSAATRRFGQNLEEIVEVARSAGVQPVLCTVTSNLADWQPAGGTLAAELDDDAVVRFAIHWANARRLASVGRGEDALGELENARAVDSGYAPLSFRSGLILRSLGRYSQAKERFVEALENDATPIRALPAFNEQVRWVAALNDVALVDLEPVFSQASPDGITGDGLFLDYCHPNSRGHQLVSRSLQPAVEGVLGLDPGPVDVAAVDLEEGGGSEVPESGFGSWWLGNVELRQGRPSSAEEHLRHALELKPEEHRTRVSLAQALQARGQEDEALKLLRESVDLAPDSVMILNNLGIQLSRMGQLDEAMSVFERALELGRDAGTVHLNIGSVYLRRREPEKALLHLNEARRLAPHLVGLNRNTGLAQELVGDSAGAAQSFLAEIRRNPADAASALRLARSLHTVGRQELARAALDLATILGHPGAAKVAVELGFAQDESPGPDETE